MTDGALMQVTQNLWTFIFGDPQNSHGHGLGHPVLGGLAGVEVKINGPRDPF